MADNKKYYWLKLKEDFFKQRPIKKLRQIAGGDTYTIIYLKMQLLSLKNDGIVVFEGVEENIMDELALELDENVEDVQMTILFLEKHGLIECLSSEEYLLPEAVGNMGSESTSAERMRRLREKQRTSQSYALPSHCDSDVTTSDACVTQRKRKRKERRDIKLLCPSEAGRENIQEDDFKKIYDIYPKKVGRAKAFEHYRSWLKGRTIDGKKIKLDNRQIYIAVRNYVRQQEESGTELQYYKNFDTFMNKSILDYLEEETSNHERTGVLSANEIARRIQQGY